MAAAGELWPGELVCWRAHVPSVTSYVHQVRVGDRSLVAKYSVLGVSLVSMARGVHGGVEEVLQAQRGYVRANTALLVREVGQLRLLRQLGMRVCVPAGYAHGVLFTEAVPGTPLDEALLADPARAGELLGRVWAPLAVLHGQSAAGWPVIGERSIVDTFDRKFSSDHYLDELAGEMVDPSQAGALRAVVAVLRRIPRPPVAGSALAFGDVKPEHILVGVEG